MDGSLPRIPLERILGGVLTQDPIRENIMDGSLRRIPLERILWRAPCLGSY